MNTSVVAPSPAGERGKRTAAITLTRRLTLAIAVVLAMASWSLPAALAGDRMSDRSDRVTIMIHVDFATGSEWSSTGALVDQGSVMPVRQRFVSLQPPRWMAHEDILFTGRDGSFTIRQHVLLIDLSPTLTVGRALWVVRSGTGAYAGIRGHGTGTLEFHWDAGAGGTLDVTMEGQIHVPAA